MWSLAIQGQMGLSVSLQKAKAPRPVMTLGASPETVNPPPARGGLAALARTAYTWRRPPSRLEALKDSELLLGA